MEFCGCGFRLNCKGDLIVMVIVLGRNVGPGSGVGFKHEADPLTQKLKLRTNLTQEVKLIDELISSDSNFLFNL